MLVAFLYAVGVLGQHVGAAIWAFVFFLCGFALAFPVVRCDVHSLLAFPLWLMRMARRYLKPGISPVLLCSVILGFNTVAIFVYMISGGLMFLPILFDLLTGLNVGIVMLKDRREESDGMGEPRPGDATAAPPFAPRAWVGLLSIFVVVVELTAFWLSIGMGIRLGNAMRADFTWATFVDNALPRVLAYVLVIVPALAVSAVAETAAIKAMLGRRPEANVCGREAAKGE